MRAGALLAGAAALIVVGLVPDRPLSSHMVGHLLLIMVAAPLIALGAPVRTLLRALPPRGRRSFGLALTSRAVRLLSHPLVGWCVFVAVILLTHLTGFFDLAERHPLLHALEHWLYLVSALIFWMGLFGADPIPHRLGWLGRSASVLLAMPAMSIVGILLIQSSRVRYAAYLGPGALADQRAAGNVMWLGGAIVGALWLFAVGWAALLGEERRQRAREFHADIRARG